MAGPSDECDIKGDGENLEIGFNNRYLLEALRAAPADLIRINITSGISPCVIIPADGEQQFSLYDPAGPPESQ